MQVASQKNYIACLNIKRNKCNISICLTVIFYGKRFHENSTLDLTKISRVFCNAKMKRIARILLSFHVSSNLFEETLLRVRFLR